MTPIQKYIQQHSGLEQKRPYIGMSAIGDCSRRIILTYRNGITTDFKAHLNAFRGYRMEAIAKDILIGSGIMKPSSEAALQIFSMMVQGHTDGETVDGQLIEIKSKRKDKFDEILYTGKLPIRDYHQVQCYMQYGGYTQAKVFVLCPETFDSHILTIHRNDTVIKRIVKKLELLVNAVNTGTIPDCECGKCK